MNELDGLLKAVGPWNSTVRWTPPGRTAAAPLPRGLEVLWAAAAEDPELADLPIEHPLPRSPHHNRDNGLPLTDHVELPRRAGFEHISPVWQFDTGHVLVAVR
ncbi:hypothetical protein ABZ746_08960 [Streptomyces sp. NPDC020096]